MLMQRGFNSAIAGTCISLACALNIIITPIISNYVETHNRPTIIDIPVIYSIIVIVLLIINFVTRNELIIAVTFIICMGLTNGLDPYIVSISNSFNDNNCRINFTFARACGTIGYGVFCYILGILTKTKVYTIVLYNGMLLALIFLILCLLTKKDYQFVKDKEISKEKEETVSLKEFLKNNKSFLLMCLFISGLFFGNSVIENFLVIVLENIGGSITDSGKIEGFKCIFEAIAIFAFPLINKKIKLNNILIISAISFVIKISLVCFAKNIIFVYLAQIMQMSSYAFLMPAIIIYINENMSKQETIRGNAFYSLSVQFGMVISSFISGIITNSFGITTSEYVAVVIAIVSSLGFILTLTNIKK